MMNFIQTLDFCKSKTQQLQNIIPIKSHQNRIDQIDASINNGKLWDNPQQAAILMKERQKLFDLLNKLNYFIEQIKFFEECLKDIPNDLEEISPILNTLQQEIIDFEFKQIMSDPVDNTSAILTISAGAGGLESANWVSMLLRMYCRYADCYNFKVEILDMKNSEEHSSICIDNVSIKIDGPYAYGFLKNENGIHRLIRNSPFSSSDSRHTSFAAVSVEPDIEDTIDIKINDNDLEIITQTAGGAGGQHQNRIKSAIRLKHIPSGIHFVVRSERSQHENRRIAMKMLKAKLYDLELKKKQQQQDGKISQQANAAFSSQIRTVTLTPYELVKDHRSNYETNNASSFLDGNIQDILLSVLQSNK